MFNFTPLIISRANSRPWVRLSLVWIESTHLVKVLKQSSYGCSGFTSNWTNSSQNSRGFRNAWFVSTHDKEEHTIPSRLMIQLWAERIKEIGRVTCAQAIFFKAKAICMAASFLRTMLCSTGISSRLHVKWVNSSHDYSVSPRNWSAWDFFYSNQRMTQARNHSIRVN